MSKQVVIDALKRNKEYAYTPIIVTSTTATINMMEKSGAFWPDAHCDPEKMALLGSMPHVMYGFNSVKVPFDVVVEAEVLGATVDYGSVDIYPQVRNSKIKSADELVMPDNLADKGRIPVVMEAIRRLRNRFPDVTVACHIMGPVSISSMMFGFETLLEWIIDEDPNFAKAMEFCTKFTMQYAKLVEEAGAEVLEIGEAAASGEILGAKTYKANIMPYHQRLATAVNIPLVMHICGDISSYLPLFSLCNIDSINFDHSTSMSEAHRILGLNVKTSGNVDPVGVLLKGTPGDIKREVYKCLDSGVDVLTPGCAIAPRTSDENLRAFVDAYKSYMKEKGIKLI